MGSLVESTINPFQGIVTSIIYRPGYAFYHVQPIGLLENGDRPGCIRFQSAYWLKEIALNPYPIPRPGKSNARSV